MKIITAILWCQLALGLVIAFMGYGDVHSAAMGMEYGRGMRRDFEQVKQSPAYREPPEVRGYSFSRLIEDKYTSARQRGHAALLTFGTGIGASLLAGVLLWLLGRVRPRKHEQAAT